jgi:hypothetical protein
LEDSLSVHRETVQSEEDLDRRSIFNLIEPPLLKSRRKLLKRLGVVRKKALQF